MEIGWTIDELAGRAARAITAGRVRSTSRRVTDLPDRRTIRWYATIGLLDPPLSRAGGAARYGQRHLLQLVAVKRRQVTGRSLGEIRDELAGASDVSLRRIARLPPALLGEPEPAGGAAREAAGRSATVNGPTAIAAWDARPEHSWPDGPRPMPLAASRPESLVYGMTLAAGVTLLLPYHPSADEQVALRSAARGLVDTVAAQQPDGGGGRA